MNNGHVGGIRRTFSAPTKLVSILNIAASWIYVQIRQGRLLIDRQPNGAHLFANTSNVVEAVRKLRDHNIDRLNLK